MIPRSSPVAVAAGPEHSIIVPTYNERANVSELICRTAKVLKGVCWEIVFVDDDSPDGTGELVRALGEADARVRCVQRVGRRGLSSPCVEDLLSSSALFVAVMDADLQHDEALLPAMLQALRVEPLDIVVGSRYVSGGGDWSAGSLQISRLAIHISHLVVPPTLTDPMSGFFMLRREAFHACVRQLSAVGFRILVDLFASAPQRLRFKEMPLTLRIHLAIESKLDNQVGRDYGMLPDRLIGHVVPVCFLSFALIGGLGVFAHVTVLALVFRGFGADFGTGQALATAVAMVFNFAINNVLTYRGRQLRGLDWFKGSGSFVLACSIGAFANVGIANYIFGLDRSWLLAALAGILVRAVWNYAVTSVYTWAKKPPATHAG